MGGASPTTEDQAVAFAQLTLDMARDNADALLSKFPEEVVLTRSDRWEDGVQNLSIEDRRRVTSAIPELIFWHYHKGLHINFAEKVRAYRSTSGKR